jgi:heptosyltransferase-2
LPGRTEAGPAAAERGAKLWVRLPNWLGDVLLARPVLAALARSLGADAIRAAAPGPLLELLSGDVTFGSSDPWPPADISRAEALRRVRSWRPDLALVLPPSFSSAWDAWRTGARVRVGYRSEGRSPLLTRALARSARGARHLSDEYLELGRALGARPASASDVPPTLARLRVDEASIARARGLLAEHRLEGAPLAVLGPGAIYGPAKRWEAARFAELGARLARHGHAVAVCGTAAERSTCAMVAEAIARQGGGAVRAASLAGVTTLQAQAGLCALSALAVCNDSGLAHLSAAVGARTVVIFGSTSSAWTAPLGERVRILQHAPVCSPCFQRECRIGMPCLTAVTVDEVEAACTAGAA